MTTTDPQALPEASDEISEWRAPDLPAAPLLSDRAVRVLTVLAVVASAACLVLTIVWRAQSDANRSASSRIEAAVVGAAAGATELERQIVDLQAQVATLRQQIDAQKIGFLGSIRERDLARDQLAATEAQLAQLQSQVDGTYATVLTQGDTMSLLGDCLRGVGRVLNLAAIDKDREAAAELFAHYGSCVQANEALSAPR